MRKLLLLSIFALFLNSIYAQNENSNYSQKNIIFGASIFFEMANDSIFIKIPSLNELISNAKNSSQVKYYDAQKEVDEKRLKTIKRAWMDYIKLTASYQYGVVDSYMMYVQSDVVLPPNDKYSHQAQSYYLLGAGIYLPISEILNRRNKIKQQKLATKEKDLQAQMWHDDQSLKIVECYTEALENISLMNILMEEYSIAMAQYSVSEVDFVKGQIDIQELNRGKSMLSSAKINYEKNKMVLLKNILKLEILSNTNIISQRINTNN